MLDQPSAPSPVSEGFFVALPSPPAFPQKTHPAGPPAESDASELILETLDTPSVDASKLDDHVRLSLETTGVTSEIQSKKKAQREFWKEHSAFKWSVEAKLREVGDIERADKLRSCHEQMVVGQCTNCGKSQTFYRRCDNFFCPECQPTLAKKRQESIGWWMNQVAQPKHVVLTLRNVSDLSRDHIKFAKQSLTRLRGRKFCKNWVGGFWSLEVTNEGRGWHIHFHLLIDARWIDQQQLAIEWNAANKGFGHICYVKDGRKSDYKKEVAKYVVKGSLLAKWSGRDIQTFCVALDGERTFGVFGTLYGKRTQWREWIASIDATKARCTCGCNELLYYSESEWLARDCIPKSEGETSRPPPAEHPELFPLRSRFDLIRSAIGK